MLNPAHSYLNTHHLKQPQLIIVIDTEEEFDWAQPFERKNTDVKNIAHQEKAQKLFAKYGIKPTYVIDYPVASQPDGIKPLKELHDQQLCDIGAHLHPWVTPPFIETVNNRNSFPGNLSYQQEYQKLKNLTQTIETNFGFSPTIYKAGRYGVGNNTSQILKELGYLIDCSVVPNTDFRSSEGPNFSQQKNCQPYWFADNTILEIPLTVDYVGLLSTTGNILYNTIQQDKYIKLRVPGILSRLGLFERIRLSPEGHTLDELKRLTLSMLRQQHKIFCLTYHSSTLMIGGSPYANNKEQLNAFLHTLESYIEFFSTTLNGQFSTLNTLHRSDVIN